MLRLNVQDSRKSQHCLWFVIGEKKQQANQSETTHCAKISTNAAHVDLASYQETEDLEQIEGENLINYPFSF